MDGKDIFSEDEPNDSDGENIVGNFDEFETREEQNMIYLIATTLVMKILQKKLCLLEGNAAKEYLTIDEKLEAFGGRCSFKHFIPSKSRKYPIKICAAKIFYTKSLEVYDGQHPEGPYCVSNGFEAIVKSLSSSIHDTGRDITLDISALC
ncbi:hypothetical protein JTB14_016651 [Gonioctena quinquepunctata]|nr:hypothetical protein JTB14_016651 [Gonioctena quinquepunctata]